MHPGFVLALSWGYSLCSVCSRLSFHRFGPRRFDYERSYVMLLGALRKYLKNDCVAMDPSERFDYIVSIFPRVPCDVSQISLTRISR